MAAPQIAVHKFWTNYHPEKDRPDPDNPGKIIKGDPAKLVPMDMVSYGPVGSHDRSVTACSVASLSRLQPLEGSQNPAVIMAHERWAVIERHYDAWKKGQEAPLDGTPLAAWNALTPEQADVLRVKGFKTVESIAAMTDAHMRTLPMPAQDLKRQAQAFIDAADQTRFAATIIAKDEKMAALEAEAAERAAREAEKDRTIAALIEKVNALAEAVASKDADAGDLLADPGKRGPGRPPKQSQATA